MSNVIAICGTMGVGKSTLAAALRERISDSVIVAEDDFNPVFRHSLETVQEWWEQGADTGQIDLRQVVMEIRSSQQRGQTVLLETQFGRLHPLLRPLIDIQIWLQAPLDVAFARRTAQLADGWRRSPETDMKRTAEWLHEYSLGYLRVRRSMLVWQQQTLPDQSDFQLNAAASPDQLLRQALTVLNLQQDELS